MCLKWFHHIRKLNEYVNENSIDITEADKQKDEINDADDDEVIANILQDQFNEEHDMMLKRMEEKVNRDSKGNKDYNSSLCIQVIILNYFSYFSGYLIH